MAEPTLPVCWICGAPLRVAITRNRNDKTALTPWCGTDGRHLRAFCNHRPTVEEVVSRLEAQAAAVPALTAGNDPPAPTQQALQETSEDRATKPVAKKRRRAG